MKIDKLKLIKSLQEIGKFTDQHSRNMRNILIDGENQKISAISYDSYAEMHTPIKDFHVQRGQLKATEKFCLQPATLLGMVRSVETPTVHLRSEKFKVIDDAFFSEFLQVGDCFQEIPLHPISKFSDGSIYGSLKKIGEIEKDELRQVVSACQKEADIPYREYIQIDLDNNRIAGMDGKRFHICRVNLKGTGKILVPGSLLQKMTHRDWELFVTPQMKYVCFGSGNIKIQAENDTDSVQYPDYDHRMTQKMSYQVKVPTEMFRQMVSQAELMSGKEYRAADFEFSDKIDCILRNPTKGCYNKTGIEMSGLVDPPIGITLDLKFLKQAIAGFGNETTTTIEVDQVEKFLRLSMGKFSSVIMKML